ncbi:phage holin family protein [Candidatus Roizmanbacteria bacterium]|nr:phage holin family protein [Candidatus Roizmanbacteria bacterium]
MRKISRMLLFSSVAFYLTALWNKGIILPVYWVHLVVSVVLIALTSYLVVPLSKVVLFPINILTFGLLSILCYVGLFYILDTYLSLVQFNNWVFPGITIIGVSLQKVAISYAGNLLLSALSTSAIINILERLT